MKIDEILKIKEQYQSQFLELELVVGVGIGRSGNLKIYVMSKKDNYDKLKADLQKISKMAETLPIEIVLLGDIELFNAIKLQK